MSKHSSSSIYLVLLLALISVSSVVCANAAMERTAALEKRGQHQAWADYKLKFEKSYLNNEHENRRMKIFMSNLQAIEKHNELYEQGKVTYKMAVNHLADLSHEEYMQLNGFRPSKKQSAVQAASAPAFVAPNNGSVPAAIDWRDHGYVTSVKNQRSCGSCWAFSATGALEGQHKRATGKLVSLSEQNLVDCSKENQGCNGGLMDLAFEYIEKNEGIDTAKSYPYKGHDAKCHFKRRFVGATDKGFVDLPVKDEDAMKAAVGTLGPVSVAIDASSLGFQFYHSGVYNNPNCFQELNHGVLVVGYGTDAKQGDYWIVKNSWGTSYGKDGYMLMARGKNMCGIAEAASYPLV